MPDPFILICAAGALIAIPTVRHLIRRKGQFQLADGGETREQRKSREEAAAAAFKDVQRQYFALYGIKVVETRSTPRVADTGTLYLDPDVTERRENDYCVYEQKPPCRYGCGQVIVGISEIAPGSGAGVDWRDIGRYCASCGAWDFPGSYETHFNPTGPLGRRLKGATNIFDALGPPKTEAAEAEWVRLEAEQSSLEARLNDVRSRRLALADKLGKPIAGGPFRPQLVEKTGT
jgi:hypothetical protein